MPMCRCAVDTARTLWDDNRKQCYLAVLILHRRRSKASCHEEVDIWCYVMMYVV